MEVKFRGKVFKVLPLQTGMGQRGPWSRATVVFEVPNGRFLDKIACENSRDAEKFSKLQVGQTVNVSGDLRSNEYQEKWYTRVECFDYSVEGAQPTYSAPQATNSGEPF